MSATTAAAAQLWQTAQYLSTRVIDKREISLDNRDRLQKTIEQLLLIDLDYAIEHQAETMLWTCCHKQCIDVLLGNMRHKNTDSSALYSIILNAAFGSLHQLLIRVISTYNITLATVNSDALLGAICHPEQYDKCHASVDSCRRFVQFCLVHLGDICRYQKNIQSAESFYRYALDNDANDGHAWNQMAILDSLQSAKLSAIYHYVRAISVANAFAPAAANIDQIYAQMIATHGLDIDVSKNYINAFLVFHAHCHQLLKLRSIEMLLDRLTTQWSIELKQCTINWTSVLQMFAINIAALYRLGSGRDEMIIAEMINCLVSTHAIGLIDYCSQIDTDSMARWLFCLLVMLKWIELGNRQIKYTNMEHAIKSVCNCAVAIRKLVDGDTTNNVDDMGCMQFDGFIPLNNISIPVENISLKCLHSCRHLLVDLIRITDSSADTSTLATVDESQLWLIVQTLIPIDESLLDQQISTTNESVVVRSQATPSPTMRRRQTRVAPFLKMMENQQQKFDDDSMLKEAETTEMEPGLLKIKLPTSNDSTNDKDGKSRQNATTTPPPRFMAQKLRQALATSASSTAIRRSPTSIATQPMFVQLQNRPVPQSSDADRTVLSSVVTRAKMSSPTNATVPAAVDFDQIHPTTTYALESAAPSTSSTIVNSSSNLPPPPLPINSDRSFDPWTIPTAIGNDWFVSKPNEMQPGLTYRHPTSGTLIAQNLPNQFYAMPYRLPSRPVVIGSIQHHPMQPSGASRYPLNYTQWSNANQ